MQPHYVRKDTKREFLGSDLNITKMYQLYKEWLVEKDETPVQLHTYRKLFNENYNFSFHQPKKDQCSTCTEYWIKREQGPVLKKDQDSYDDHQTWKIQAREKKEKDKERAIKDKTSHVSTFDLEAVLTTPCSLVSQLYYKRKLNVYNLTTYSLADKKGTCYMWDETNGKRGSCEIGTCLYLHLSSLGIQVDHACCICDACGGQNRNQHVAGAMMYAAKHLSLSIIDIVFLESGHTDMECDSMHSAIECAKKAAPIYVPSQWHTVASVARRKDPYLVVPMRYSTVQPL